MQKIITKRFWLLFVFGCLAGLAACRAAQSLPAASPAATVTAARTPNASPTPRPTAAQSVRATPQPTATDEETYHSPTWFSYTPAPTTPPPDFSQLQVINRTNLKQLETLWRFESERQKILYFTFADQGKQFVYSDVDSIHFMDLASGKIVKTLRLDHVGFEYTYGLWDFVLSLDEHYLAAIVDPGFVVWDVTTGETLWSQGPFDAILTDLTFSPNNKYLVSTGISSGGETFVWSVADGSLYRDLNFDQQTDAQFSHDGSRLYLVSRVDLPDIEVIDTQTWKMVDFNHDDDGYDRLGHALTFSPNEKLAALIQNDLHQIIYLYSTDDWHIFGEISDHNYFVYNSTLYPNFDRHILASPSFNADGGILAFVAGDASGDIEQWSMTSWNLEIQFWNPLTQKILLRYPTGLPAPIRIVKFSPDGRLLAAESQNGTILFFGVPGK